MKMELYDYPNTIVFTSPLPDLDQYNFPKDISILDLGCGYGRVLKHCEEQGFNNLTGIDISEKLIERARQNCEQASYYVGEMTNLTGLGRYDLIMLCGVIEYLVTDSERDKLIDEIKNHLAPRGKVLLETFLLDSTDDFYLKNQEKGFPYGTIQLKSGLILRHETVSGIDALFQNKGFTKCHSKELPFTTWVNATTPGYIVLFEK